MGLTTVSVGLGTDSEIVIKFEQSTGAIFDAIVFLQVLGDRINDIQNDIACFGKIVAISSSTGCMMVFILIISCS